MMLPAVLQLAYTAIVAGHKAGVAEDLNVTRQTSKRRHARTYTAPKEKASEDEDPTTAEQWIYSLPPAREGTEEYAAAGTPFHFLYWLGWSVGKQREGLLIALVPVLFCWGFFLVEAVRDSGTNFASEVWAVLFVKFVLSGGSTTHRVAKRTPKKFFAAGASGIWAALVFEVVLMNTPSFVALGVGILASNTEQIPLDEGSMLLAARIVAFACPPCLWYYLQNMVRDRQMAFLDQQVGKVQRQASNAQEMHGDGNDWRDREDWPHRVEIASKHVLAIVKGSMDLRPTGLSVEELNRLADILGEATEGARGIRFYTRMVEKRDAFKLLCEFDEGYKNRGRDCEDSARTAAVSPDDFPWDAAQSKFDSEMLPQLWGARARAWDGDGDDSRQWYAICAAALTANRDPLSVIIAKEQDGDLQARGMVEGLRTGCKQVLSLVDSDPCFSERRGLVFITTDEKVPTKMPTVTYSPAEIWQAEDTREAVMLGKDTFNLLWQAREERRSLNDKEKADLKSKSAVLWGKVLILVDFTCKYKFLGVTDASLVDVRAAARRGFFMHLAWVVCSIVIRLRFVSSGLPLLTLVAQVYLRVFKTDQCAHFLYVAIRAWRRFAPLRRGDSDMNNLACNCFRLAVGAVNYGSAFFGWWRYKTPVDKAMFWVLLVGSVMPGLWILVLKNDRASETEKGYDDSGGAVVRYEGMKRGEDPDRFGPLGRGVLEGHTPPPPAAAAGWSQDLAAGEGVV